MTDYRTEVIVKKLPVSQLKNYLTPKEVLEACRQCPDFGKEWSCPPGLPDVYEYLAPFKEAFLIAVKVHYSSELRERVVTAEGLEEVRVQIYDKVQRQMQLILLELEKRNPGSLSISTCFLCNRCTRRDHKPCAHPDRMRYSMTAMGFQFTKLLKEEMGIELQWVSGRLPEYNVMVSTLLCN